MGDNSPVRANPSQLGRTALQRARQAAETTLAAERLHWAGWIAVAITGAFVVMCLALVVMSFGLRVPPLSACETFSGYVGEIAKDYAALILAPLGAVVGYFLARHEA